MKDAVELYKIIIPDGARRPLSTGDPEQDLVTFWEIHLRRAGLTITEDDRVLTAYVNHDRWVANCPNDNGGIVTLPGFDYGCCLDCGYRYEITHPSEKDSNEAEAILNERTHDKNRNWYPTKETIKNLEDENTKHGDTVPTRT